MADSASTNSLVDGCWQSDIPVSDRGLCYADGLFETVLMRHGSIALWDWHWRRMNTSAERLGIRCPDESVWRRDIDLLTESQGDWLLKLMLTRGSSGRGYAPDDNAVPRRIVQRFEALSDRPLVHQRVILCQTPLASSPALAGLKHLGRLEQVLARQEVIKAGASEGLMLDPNGMLIECTQNNLFLWRDDQWWTPSVDEAGVNGVFRQWLMSTISVTEVQLRPSDLVHYQSAFCCNSVRGIQPVIEVSGVTEFDRRHCDSLVSQLAMT